MVTEALVRYLHFISIFAWVSSVVAEHLLLKDSMSRKELKRMLVIDRIYGLAAILTVAGGLLLWFAVGKPAEFYTQNWIFHTKVGLAIVMGIISIYPSLFFAKNQKGDPTEQVAIPSGIKCQWTQHRCFSLKAFPIFKLNSAYTHQILRFNINKSYSMNILKINLLS